MKKIIFFFVLLVFLNNIVGCDAKRAESPCGYTEEKIFLNETETSYGSYVRVCTLYDVYRTSYGGGGTDCDPAGTYYMGQEEVCGEERYRKCGTPIQSTQIILPYDKSSSILGITDLYFNFSPALSGNYTISLTVGSSNVDWELVESSSSCLDGKVDVPGGFSKNAGTDPDIKTVNNLKLGKTYVLHLYSGGSPTTYTLRIYKF